MTRRTTGARVAARTTALLATLAVALLISGCGSSLKPAKVDPNAEASATATQGTPGPPPPPPKVGDCYELTYKASLEPTSDAAPVPCKKKHTSVTIYVGTFDPIVDGHLLAVDSDEVQAQIARACPTKIADWVGGSEQSLQLSRFKTTYFSPTLKGSDSGADWFRCDLVAKRGAKSLIELTGTKGALDDPASLDTYGTCSTTDPAKDDSRPEACTEPHSWRAVSVIKIEKDAHYLGPRTQKAVDEACKAVAQQRATDPLKLTWSFQWPKEEAFTAGQRYGLCWVPDKGPEAS